MLKDSDKVGALREMGLMVGGSPGTPFEKCTIKIEMNRGENVLDYFQVSEVIELCEYFWRLSTMIGLGQTVTPSDRFTYQILKANGVFNAFEALYRLEQSK